MKEKKDPQFNALEGHAGFGVDYIPKSKRVPVLEGKIYAGKVSDYEKDRAKTFHLDRFTVAVFHTGEEFYAIKDACPHADYPLSLGKLVSPYVVMCYSHNWRFDIRDGRCVKIGKCGHVGRALRVRHFPVEVKNNEIWVQVENLPPQEPVPEPGE